MAVIPSSPEQKPITSFNNPSKGTTIATVVISICFLLVYLVGLGYMLYYYFTEDSSPTSISLKKKTKKVKDSSKTSNPSDSSNSNNPSPSPPDKSPSSPPPAVIGLGITFPSEHEEKPPPLPSRPSPQPNDPNLQHQHQHHHHYHYFNEKSNSIAAEETPPTSPSPIVTRTKSLLKKHGRKRTNTMDSTTSSMMASPRHKYPAFLLKKKASATSIDNAPQATVAEAI